MKSLTFVYVRFIWRISAAVAAVEVVLVVKVATVWSLVLRQSPPCQLHSSESSWHCSGNSSSIGSSGGNYWCSYCDCCCCCSKYQNGGGGGFFQFAENVRPFIARLRLFLFCLFLKWRLARAHYFHSFMPGSVHSGSTSEDDCGRMFPDKLRVSSFPDTFPHYARTAA